MKHGPELPLFNPRPHPIWHVWGIHFPLVQGYNTQGSVHHRQDLGLLERLPLLALPRPLAVGLAPLLCLGHPGPAPAVEKKVDGFRLSNPNTNPTKSFKI